MLTLTKRVYRRVTPKKHKKAQKRSKVAEILADESLLEVFLAQH